jgi:hypothetical protein
MSKNTVEQINAEHEAVKASDSTALDHGIAARETSRGGSPTRYRMADLPTRTNLGPPVWRKRCRLRTLNDISKVHRLGV